VVNPATGAEIPRAADANGAAISPARAQRACAKAPARKRGAMVSASAAASADQPEAVASLWTKNLKVRFGLAHRLEAGWRRSTSTALCSRTSPKAA